MRRFFAYALRYKALLAVALGFAVFKFVLIYAFPWIIGTATDVLAATGAFEAASMDRRNRWLFWLVVAGVIISVLHGVTWYGRGFYAQMLGVRVIRDVRQDLFNHLHRLSLYFYSKERSGSIASRLLGDISNASQIINGGVINVAMDTASIFVGLGFMLYIDWRLTLASMLAIPPYILLFKFLNPRVRRASWLVQSSFSRISGNVQERLAGIALVKTSAAEDREQSAFAVDAEIHYGRNVRVQKLSQFVASCAELLVHLNQIVVIGYGGYLALRGDITPGDVVKFIGYLAVIYMPVRRFADVNLVWQQSAASIERVFQVFDITPRITERPDAVATEPTRGELRFENVFFDYHDESDESKGLPERHNPRDLRGEAVHDARRQKRREFVDKGRLRQRRRGTDVYAERKRAAQDRYFNRNTERDWVLDNLDFTVAPGEKVALVGPSGAGKTTLVSLLPRLYDVDHGAIKIDDVDIRDYRLDVLRRAIGIVQQDSFLFSGSVRDNLKYGKPNATDDEMIAAARAANAHDFISKLDDGYDSRVGERGVSLSGGQKQRLSIARAILKDPRILILDEATSALDTESERLVQEALERLMENRTSLIIAHRLSTVRNADRILVLKEGRVVESGCHDGLVAEGGLYARLVRQQFGPDASVNE